MCDIPKNDIIILLILLVFIIILLYVNKNKIFSGFENNTTSTTRTTSSLDENGFIKNEIIPSYWYNYAPSEIRSKCFDCDASSSNKHPSNCFDCEIGGRPVDKLFNRVLSR